MSVNNSIRRNGPLWLSLLAGIVIWEIAGRSTSAAFMVPFSETLVRLWQLVTRGEFIAQFIDSAELFLTGFLLAIGTYKKMPERAEKQGHAPRDRAFFLSLVGIVMSLFFAVIIIAAAVPRWILSPCS